MRAWVDEIPDDELEVHYAKAVEDLDQEDLSMLAAWHASLDVGQPVANKDFLVGAFRSLGEHRREALRIAAGFRGDEAFEAGASEEHALETVLPWLSDDRAMELGQVGFRQLAATSADRAVTEQALMHSPYNGRRRGTELLA